MKIGLATYQGQKTLTEDDQKMLPYLDKMGFSPTPFDWRHEPLSQKFDAIVTRSCWDFGSHVDEFRSWLSKLNHFDGLVLNSPELLMWNHSKKYLLELAAKGANMPTTVLLEKGGAVEKENIREIIRNFKAVILKPAISVCGFDTFKFESNDIETITSQTNVLLRSRDVIIQDFIPEIQTRGEISFVFFRGQFSHAVRKIPKNGEFRIQEEHGGRREAYLPSLALLDQAYNYLRFIKTKTLFARVDCIEQEGSLFLIELELIHPMLFLRYDRFAAQKFANALAAELAYSHNKKMDTSA